MSDARPLLAFPPPARGTIPKSSPSYFPRVRPPSPARQGERLAPRFQTLQDTLAGARTELTISTGSPEPELVVVFDLKGTADKFLRATQKIDGLEFLADFREEDVEPTKDFHRREKDGSQSDDAIPQSLYMVMSNAQAVADLVRLFELWQDDRAITFATGLNPLKDVFKLLDDVRRWGTSDRVRETGLLERWAEDVGVSKGSPARVEIELWYRADAQIRQRAASTVGELVENVGGAVVTTADIGGIGYHAILADIPYNQVQRVLDDGPAAIELLRAEDVMFVGAHVPMAFPVDESGDEADLPEFDIRLPTEPPRIALLDGLPVANHVALANRLEIDDPDEVESDYAVELRRHGTAMASIIVHGDLSRPEPALTRRLYVRPLLEPHWSGDEVTPQAQLLVDLVHRSLRRIVEGDGAQSAVAPSVRIVNLSIGDPGRAFVRRLSPLARLLDWFAFEYNLVVVVSAGNHPGTLSVPRAALGDPSAMSEATLRTGLAEARHRRLLSPAESINAITVGATHADGTSDSLPDTVVDPLEPGLPATYSSTGFGFRRSVKPDVHLPGGRQLFSRPPNSDDELVELPQLDSPVRAPGIRVGAPGVAGQLNGEVFTVGTSNAAASATRTVSTIFDVLEAATAATDEFPFPDAGYHPVLAKALLTHAAGWRDLGGRIQSALGLSGLETRRELTRMLGYGPVDQERVANADRVRVVLLGASSFEKEGRDTYRFPLPTSLASKREWRRLTVTLAWLSPVNHRSQKYRMARLWFTSPTDELKIKPIEAYHHAVRNGCLQHEVLEGEKAAAFTDGDDLVVDVDCRSETGKKFERPVRYGLVASLEVGATLLNDIHGEVRSALRSRVRAAQEEARIET